MNKRAIREQFKAIRQSLDAESRAEKAEAVCAKLKTIVDWDKVEYLHVYEPIEALGEVNIAPCVEKIKQKYPKIQIYTSRKIAEKWRITSIGGESLDQLPKFDIIIVPMLGFDSTLHRIGYGGGYYDRFLATQPDANKIGVCFDELQVAQLPVEATDIPLNKIITDKQIYGI